MTIPRWRYLYDLGLDAITEDDYRPSLPWYYLVMQGVGAWIASLLFLVPVVVSFFSGNMLAVGIGGLVLLIAVAVVRVEESVFISQLLLAAALLGFAMLNVGLAERVDGNELFICLNITATALLCYAAIRRRAVRFMVALAVLAAWMWRLSGDPNGPHVIFAAAGGGMLLAFVLFPERRFLRPLGYASALAGPAALFLLRSLDALLPSSLVAGVVGVIVVLIQSRRQGWQPVHAAAGMAGLSALALAAPGAAMGVGAAIWGHATANRLLEGIGLLWVPCFVSWFYYWLGYDLLTKSLLLAGSGVLLLGLRFYFRREAGHA